MTVVEKIFVAQSPEVPAFNDSLTIEGKNVATAAGGGYATLLVIFRSDGSAIYQNSLNTHQKKKRQGGTTSV